MRRDHDRGPGPGVDSASLRAGERLFAHRRGLPGWICLHRSVVERALCRSVREAADTSVSPGQKKRHQSKERVCRKNDSKAKRPATSLWWLTNRTGWRTRLRTDRVDGIDGWETRAAQLSRTSAEQLRAYTTAMPRVERCHFRYR